VAHDVGTTVAQELLARDLEGRLDVDVMSVTWLNSAMYPDLYRPTDSQLALLDASKGPAVVSFVDCSHYPHTERPDDVAREMLRPW
jgi:hypothetical protein